MTTDDPPGTPATILMPQPTLPELSPAELRERSDVATLSALRGLGVGMLTVYTFLALAHTAVVPPPNNFVLASVAFVSAILAPIVGLAVQRRNDPRLAQPAVAFMAFLVLFNCLVHVFLTREMVQSTNLMLYIVGVGGLFFVLKWAVGAVIFAWIGWIWVAFFSDNAHRRWVQAFAEMFPTLPTPPLATVDVASDPMTVHFIFGLFSASSLAYVIFRSRLLLFTNEERIRKHDAVQRERLSELSKRYRDVADLATQANMAKSEFLRNVSHELRTPLHGIMGLSNELLACRLNDDERELAGTIRASGETLLGIVEDILDFSRIEAGRLDIKPAPFDLRSAVHGIVKPFQLTANQHGLDLSLVVDHDVPEIIVADRNRIGQILTNLVGNAVKFTDAGMVSVRISLVPGSPGSGINARPRLRFSVRDTGVGIPASKQSVIFQPFVQADGSLSRRHGGSGLGLAISQRLAEMMGGSIWLASSDIGTGSEFAFEIPVEDVAVKVAVGEPELWDVETLKHESGTIRAGSGPLRAESGTLRAESGTIRAGSGFLSSESVKMLNESDTLVEEPPLVGGGGLVPIMPLPLPTIVGPPLNSPLILDPTTSGSPSTPSGLRNRKDNKKPNGSFDQSGGYFALPVGHGKEGLPATPKLEPRQPLRILVAEDNPTNMMLIHRLLTRKGHSVVMTGDGEECLDVYNSSPEPFDVVISDVQMPKVGGLEVVKQIREWEAQGIKPRIPVIALTAHALEQDRLACLEAGFDEWLPKPLDQLRLFATLGRLVPVPASARN